MSGGYFLRQAAGICRCRRYTVGAGGKQWVPGGAGGKQWVPGGAEASNGCLEVQEPSKRGKRQAMGAWKCRRQAASIWRQKIYSDDPFQTVPGSIPGSYIVAFTGTPTNLQSSVHPL